MEFPKGVTPLHIDVARYQCPRLRIKCSSIQELLFILFPVPRGLIFLNALMQVSSYNLQARYHSP